MKRILWGFVCLATLCLMCSALPASSNVKNPTSEETKATAKEAQDEYSLERDSTRRHPLKPSDTSSPRATLQGFIDNMNRAYSILMAAHRENIETPGLFASEAVQQMARDAEILLERGVYCLNLSEVPEGFRDPVGHEGALMLKDIFDRIELPPFSQMPDAMGIDQEEEQKYIAEFTRWRVPNTTIEIARVQDGHRQGEYLFTPRTVARLKTFYEKVQDLPYKSAVSTSSDFFEFYVSNPGRLLPPKWSQWLPAWSAALYFGQTVWQWCALAVGLFLTLVFLIALYRRFRARAASLATARRLWRWSLLALMTSGMILALYYVLYEHVNITGSVRIVLRTIVSVLSWLLWATAIFFGGSATAETIIASPTIDPEGIQASYLRALFGVVGFVTAAAIFIYGLSRVGVSLIPLLTAVGVGGLALSLAARPTLENIIGSFMIFADKPYRVGHRIRAMGQDGTVESIGLRSTKIRLLNGHLSSIPNEKMAAVDIENIGHRPYIRRVLNVTITYDTPPDKITRALEILREILAVPEAPDPPEDVDSTGSFAGSTATEDDAEQQLHPNEAINQPDFPPRVYFNDLNADSLNILVIYWYHPPQMWNYLEHATWVNIQLMERFKTEGIDFAFPTQTLHLAGDDNRPLTVDQRGVSKEEASSPSTILAQAATLGAQAVQPPQTPASDAVRPKPPSQPTPDEELSDAPIEEEILFGDDEDEADKG